MPSLVKGLDKVGKGQEAQLRKLVGIDGDSRDAEVNRSELHLLDELRIAAQGLTVIDIHLILPASILLHFVGKEQGCLVPWTIRRISVTKLEDRGCLSCLIKKRNDEANKQYDQETFP